VQSKREGKGFIAALFWNAAQPSESCTHTGGAALDRSCVTGTKWLRRITHGRGGRLNAQPNLHCTHGPARTSVCVH
jgi:hypothetical protein